MSKSYCQGAKFLAGQMPTASTNDPGVACQEVMSKERVESQEEAEEMEVALELSLDDYSQVDKWSA